MTEENISQEFRLKNIEEIKNYFIKEICQNELMSNKHRKVFTNLNYIEHSLILTSVFTGWISISAFASLLGIPISITSSTIGLKFCKVSVGIKKYKSTIKKKKNKHNKIVLLAKTKLCSIEFLISQTLVGSYISHDEFFSGNNVLTQYVDMKEKIKNLNTLTVHQIFQSIYKTMLLHRLKCRNPR